MSRRRPAVPSFLCLVICALTASNVHAALTLYLDAGGGTATWDNSTTPDWLTNPGDPTSTTTWIDGAGAYFQGTPGTVDVSGTINSLSFLTFGVDGYTLGSAPDVGTITLDSIAGIGYSTTAITTGAGNDTINATLVGSLPGSMGIMKYGDGTLTLNGTNTFSGSAEVNQGAIILGNQNALQNANVLLYGGTLRFGSLSSATLAGLDGNSSQSLSLTNDGSQPVALTLGNNNYSGYCNLFLTGSGSLTKVGSGTLILAGYGNTYFGDTKIIGGNIAIASSNALWGSTLDYNNYGGMLALPTNGYQSTTLGGLKGSQGLSLPDNGPSTVALSVGANDQSTTYSGALSGNGLLAKIGNGTWTLSGANVHTGATVVASGTLNLANPLALQYSTLVLGSSLSVANPAGGQTVYSGGTATFDPGVSGHAFTIGGLSGWVALSLQDGPNGTGNPISLSVGNNNASATCYGNISGTGSLTKVGSGTLAFQSTNSYSGDTKISGGTLTLGSASNGLPSSTLDYNNYGGVLNFGGTIAMLGGLKGSQPLVLANVSGAAVALSVGNNNQSTSYSGPISGPPGASLSKVGSGTLTLYANNCDTVLGTGTLQVGDCYGFETGTLDAEGGSLSPGTWPWFSLGGLKGSGNLSLNGVAVSVGYNSQSTTYSGVLAGTASIEKTGSGTLTLGGANTFNGTTTITSGSIILANQNALQNSTFAGGNLQFDPSVSGHAFTLGGLSGGVSALMDIAGNPVALSVGNNNQSTTVTGNIVGPAGSSFRKVGSGTLTLNTTLNVPQRGH